MKKMLGVVVIIPILVSCDRVPRAVRNSQQVIAAFEVVHTVSLEETHTLLERTEPIPLPRVTLDELLRRSPPGTTPRPAVPETPEEAEEVSISELQGNPGSLGDGRVFKVKNESLGSPPFNGNGKVATERGQCSGSVIGPHLVLTAGHCVHPGGGGTLDRNVRFAPAYPRGAWYQATKVFVHNRWVQHGAFQWDYAILYFEIPMAVTGYFGILSNVDFGQIRPCAPPGQGCYRLGVFSYGYPAFMPFDGEQQVYDPVQHSCTRCTSGQLVFKVIGMDYYDMTCGASGGAWRTSDRRAGGIVYPPPGPTGQEGYIVGLNSFTLGPGCPPGECCPIDTGEIWSPQFITDDDLAALYHQVVQNHPR